MSPLKKVTIIVLFLMLVPVSILLAYAYNTSQHEDHGWDIVLHGITYYDTHPRVVIDRAHHNAHTARGKYRPFAEMLRMDGYTVKNGMSIEEAERVFEQFERNHNPGWDLRLYIREYIFLYISRFGLGKLPDLQYQAVKTAGVVPTLAGKM